MLLSPFAALFDLPLYIAYLDTPHSTERQPRHRRSQRPDAAPRECAGRLHALQRQARLEEGVTAGDEDEQRGALHDNLGLGAPAPEVIAQGVGEAGARGVERHLLGLGRCGLGGREDEGARGEAEDEGRGQQADIRGLVGGGDGGQAGEVDDEGGGQVRGVREEQRHAVDGAGEQGGEQRDGAVRNDVRVGDAVGVGVRRGQRAQEAEGDVGGKSLDGEG